MKNGKAWLRCLAKELRVGMLATQWCCLAFTVVFQFCIEGATRAPRQHGGAHTLPFGVGPGNVQDGEVHRWDPMLV
jgi:hypothetical protein